MKISAVLAIKDEVETYKKTLDSISGWVDEIVIADIGMEPELLRKVKKLPKVKVLPYTKPVPYIERIRQKIINKAKNEWILYVDPDEVFPSSLVKYLKENMDSYDYFTIARKNIILGHWMQHSRWWPDVQTRFFKKTAVKWSTVIHSRPKVLGKGHDVPYEDGLAIEHYNYLNYDQYLDKSRRYARAEAQGYIDRNENLTVLKGLKKGVSELMSRFYTDEGYKDGMHGFVMAFSQLMYYFQVFVYYWEMQDYPETDRRTLVRIPVDFFTHALHESLHWSRAKRLVTDPISKVKSAILKRL